MANLRSKTGQLSEPPGDRLRDPFRNQEKQRRTVNSSNMSKRYKDYQPDQMMLLPPSLEKWLPEDHLARFISDVFDEMDLSRITRRYEKGLRGQAPYNPRMMVKVLYYAGAIGTLSVPRCFMWIPGEARS